MAKGKERLDILLAKRGLVSSRERAKTSIMAGLVYVEGQRADKPGMEVAEQARIEVRGDISPFVSRGGLKLAKAVQAFGLVFAGQIIADVGASTGGFTDCVLQNGAERVYAIDVGYGQLAWKLRSDPRVVTLERVNARYLDEQSLPEKMDWVVSDVSFISLKKIFPALLKILKPEGQVIALIKPQFEAGRENVGKHGVVREPEVQERVILDVLEAAAELGFQARGLDYSPIRGPEGNIEYLAWLGLTGDRQVERSQIPEIVQAAQKGTDRHAV